MYIPKIARLTAEEIEDLQAIEKKLGNLCLIAVEKSDALYVLEAKTAPNQWTLVHEVYHEIESLQSYYNNEEKARLAKGALKNYLIARKKHGIVKRPIRVRKI